MSPAGRAIKYIAIVFAACLAITIVSGVLTGVVSILGSFLPGNSEGTVSEISGDRNNENFKSGTIEFEDIRNLDIQSSIYKVKIKKDEDADKTKIVTDNVTDSFKISYDKSTNTLKTVDKKWDSGFFKGHTRRTKGSISIYLADDVDLDNVNINVDVGSVTLEDLEMEELYINSGVGNCRCDNVKAEDATIDGGVGNVTCNDIDFEGLDIDGGVGCVDLNGVIENRTSISSGVGEVELDIDGDEEDFNIKVDTGMGSVFVDGEKMKDGANWNSSADNVLDINGGIGSVKINFE